MDISVKQGPKVGGTDVGFRISNALGEEIVAALYVWTASLPAEIEEYIGRAVAFPDNKNRDHQCKSVVIAVFLSSSYPRQGYSTAHKADPVAWRSSARIELPFKMLEEGQFDWRAVMRTLTTDLWRDLHYEQEAHQVVFKQLSRFTDMLHP